MCVYCEKEISELGTEQLDTEIYQDFGVLTVLGQSLVQHRTNLIRIQSKLWIGFSLVILQKMKNMRCPFTQKMTWLKHSPATSEMDRFHYKAKF